MQSFAVSNGLLGNVILGSLVMGKLFTELASRFTRYFEPVG